MSNNLKFSELIRPLLKWWWLLVVATFIAAVTAFLALREVPPVYMSRTTLMIGQVIFEPNPTDYELNLAQQLARAYAEVVDREPVREATKAALGLNDLPKYVARPIPGGPFLEIDVTYTDPVVAQAVAAELATQMLLQSPTSTQNDGQDRQNFIAQQLVQFEQDISKTQDQIQAKQDSLASLTSAVEIANTQTDIVALQTKLTSLQTIYANLLSGTKQGAVNSLSIFEPAGLPTKPIGPNKILILAVASLSGLILASGAAYLIEFFDDTLKIKEDVIKIFHNQVIGQIVKIPESSDRGPYVLENPRSTAAETFRALRANLEFAMADSPLKTILITSPEPGAGKTTIAVNLAITIAQSGKHVLLIDADLRKPNVHKVLALNNRVGVSDALENPNDLDSFMQPWEMENLKIMTSGPLPVGPTELIGSTKMIEFLKSIDNKVDIALIDSSPLITADALLLASRVDGVLMVVRSGHTRRENARNVSEEIQRTGAKLIGLVLNYSPGISNYYYYGY